jgi:tyrosinase
VSGLGGWGSKDADYSVPDGGFSRLPLSYPAPHTVRRNFTLLPFDVPYLFYTEPLKEGNASFSASVVESVLDTAPGDFKSFQASLEAFEVWIMNGIYLCVDFLILIKPRACTLACI